MLDILTEVYKTPGWYYKVKITFYCIQLYIAAAWFVSKPNSITVHII